MDLLQAFGLTLKRLRKIKAWSQEELAYHSGLDRTYISLLERGLRNPTLNTIFSIANCMGYKPEQFIHEINTEMNLNQGSDISES